MESLSSILQVILCWGTEIRPVLFLKIEAIVLANKEKVSFDFSAFSGKASNTFVLISGKQSPKTDVADFANPTIPCQHNIADFPNYDEWQAGGGWVDGVLIGKSNL